MELVSVIRHKVLTEGVPIRDVARQLGLSRNTIRRYVRAKVVFRAQAESVREKAWLLLMRLMHSGRDFAMVCAQHHTTWFLAAHVAAFRHLAGMVAAVAYDNLSAAVAKILIGAPRVVRPRFAAMVAHYAI